MLAVSVHENQYIALGMASTRLDRGAVAHRVRVRDDARTAVARDSCSVVGGAVVYDDSLGMGASLSQCFEDWTERDGLVAGRNDNAHVGARWVGQGRLHVVPIEVRGIGTARF
jgi:hypothetical protein